MRRLVDLCSFLDLLSGSPPPPPRRPRPAQTPYPPVVLANPIVMAIYRRQNPSDSRETNSAFVSSLTTTTQQPSTNISDIAITSHSTHLSSTSSNITTASTEVPTVGPKQPPTTGQSRNPTGDPKQPFTPGQSAGIAIGVIILALIAAVFGFFLFRRLKQSPYRWNGGGVAKPGPPTAPAEKVVASGWHEPPKDDDSMLRIFRGIDGRITDHVLNFYVASSEAGGSGGGDLATMSKGDRHALEMRVSKLGYLVSAEKSRVFTLRAVLSSLLLSRVDEGAFFTERIGGRLTSNGTGMLSSSRFNTHRDGSDI